MSGFFPPANVGSVPGGGKDMCKEKRAETGEVGDSKSRRAWKATLGSLKFIRESARN